MTALFTRGELIDALRNPVQGTTVGVGLYRHGYRQYGLDFWGTDVASEVRYFLDTVMSGRDMSGLTMIDIAAGTGKNVLEFARLGVSQALAVEIDSIGASHLLQAVIALEEAGLLPENRVSVVKDDAIRFLSSHTSSYDIVVCYGLLHVFKDPRQLDQVIDLLRKTVAPGGYLIVQAITDEYPPPVSQPELAGVIVNKETFDTGFPEGEWALIHTDNKDIEHSHAGADELHRHGSIRAVYRKNI